MIPERNDFAGSSNRSIGTAKSRYSSTTPLGTRACTDNPHVLVTRGTKADRRAASEAYLTHLLDPCGLPPKMLRTTRLADLVNAMDPKLVAEAFGMRPEGAMIYLADHLDDVRLPEP